MSAGTAQSVLIIIVAVGAVVWLIGLWFLAGSYRVAKAVPDPADPFAETEPRSASWIVGSVELDGEPATLANNAAAFLLNASSGCIRIVEQSRDRIAFERIGPPQASLPERGEIRFASVGSNRTRVDYAVETRSRRWMLGLGAMFQVLGLIALVGGYFVIQQFCIPSPDPDVRTQAIQMVQAIHFLWPPFLFAGLYRWLRRVTRDTFETLLYGLPLYQG